MATIHQKSFVWYFFMYLCNKSIHVRQLIFEYIITFFQLVQRPFHWNGQRLDNNDKTLKLHLEIRLLLHCATDLPILGKDVITTSINFEQILFIWWNKSLIEGSMVIFWWKSGYFWFEKNEFLYPIYVKTIKFLVIWHHFDNFYVKNWSQNLSKFIENGLPTRQFHHFWNYGLWTILIWI